MFSSIRIAPRTGRDRKKIPAEIVLYQLVTNKVFFFFDKIMGLLKYNFITSETFSVLVNLSGVNREKKKLFCSDRVPDAHAY